MAILEEHFYHNTITLYTSVFGTIFNNIKVSRKGNKTVLVPLAYALRQKSNVRMIENPLPDETKHKATYPRMAFLLTGWEVDDNRKTSRYHRINADIVDPQTDTVVNSQFNRVPYAFNFDLHIKTKFMDDMLEILEQIMVYFNPAVEVVVTDNPDLNKDSNINISLVSGSPEFEFQGDYEDVQSIESTLSFRLEGWLYMPTSETGIIRTINLNYHDLTNQELIDTDTIDESDLP